MGFNHDYGGIYEQPTAKHLKKKRVYISGPMTGLPGLNFPAFNTEALRLEGMGYDVVNPVDLCVNPTSWEQCMRIDLAALLTCDMIALLPGWQKSRGAHLEVNIAHQVGIEIVSAKDLTS